MRINVMNVLSVVILMLIPYQVDRVMGNVSIISTCTYIEHVGVSKDFDNFRGCQTDINIVHLVPTCT